MLKKIGSLLLAITLLGSFSLTAFAQTPDRSPNPPPKPTNVTPLASPKPKQLPVFSATSDTLNWKEDKNYTVYIGKTYTIPATSPLRSAITYRSSDETVLTISETGTVTPLKEGFTVLIYATQGNVTIGKLLTVKVNPNGTGTTTTKPTTTQNPDGSHSMTIEVNGGSGAGGTTTGNNTATSSNNNPTSPQSSREKAEGYVTYLRTYAESQGMIWSIEAKDGGFMPNVSMNASGSIEEYFASVVQRLQADGVEYLYAEVVTNNHNPSEYMIRIYR